MVREREVSRLFVSIADTLVNDFEVVDLLQRLVDGVVSVLDVDAAGVLLGRTKDRLSLTAASSEDMRTLELFELQSETGPCYAAYRSGERLDVPDLEAARGEWPEFVDRAIDLGFRAVKAFPLRLRGDSIGALNVFVQEPGQFAEDDMELGQSLADMAAIGILHERAVADAELRANQLQGALDSRVLVEQAKGVLAERLGISPGEAFERLRSHSRSNNTKLREICRRVIDEGFVPE